MAIIQFNSAQRVTGSMTTATELLKNGTDGTTTFEIMGPQRLAVFARHLPVQLNPFQRYYHGGSGLQTEDTAASQIHHKYVVLVDPPHGEPYIKPVDGLLNLVYEGPYTIRISATNLFYDVGGADLPLPPVVLETWHPTTWQLITTDDDVSYRIPEGASHMTVINSSSLDGESGAVNDGDLVLSYSTRNFTSGEDSDIKVLPGTRMPVGGYGFLNPNDSGTSPEVNILRFDNLGDGAEVWAS